MWKPSPAILSEPGIKYLEMMGIRLVHSFFFMRLILSIMGTGMIVASIVISSLEPISGIEVVYYVLGGTGGFLLLVALLQTVFGVNRWNFNKIRDLRDSGATRELKEFAYRGGLKSILAMYALVDLGEIDIQTMQGVGRSYYSKQSIYDE